MNHTQIPLTRLVRNQLISICKQVNSRVIQRKAKGKFNFMSTEKLLFGFLKLVSHSNHSMNSCIDRSNDLGRVTRQAFTKFACKQKMTAENPFRDCYRALITSIDRRYYASKQHRLLAIDGKTIRLDKDNDAGYQRKVNDTARNFANAYLNTLYDTKLGIAIAVDTAHASDERSAARKLITDHVRENDVVIMDRGYYSFEMAQHCLHSKCHFLFRVSTTANIFEQYLRELHGVDRSTFDSQTGIHVVRDEDIHLPKTVHNKNMPDIICRCVTAIIHDSEYIFVTSLADRKRYSSIQICRMYHSRWTIETFYGKYQTYDGGGADKRVHSRFQKQKMIELELDARLLYLLLNKLVDLDCIQTANQKCDPTNKRQRKGNGKGHELTPVQLVPSLAYLESEAHDNNIRTSTPHQFQINHAKILNTVSDRLPHLFDSSSLKPLGRTTLPELMAFEAVDLRADDGFDQEDWIGDEDKRMLIKSCIRIRPNRHFPRMSKGPINKWKTAKKKEAKEKMIPGRKKPKPEPKKKGRRPKQKIVEVRESVSSDGNAIQGKRTGKTQHTRTSPHSHSYSHSNSNSNPNPNPNPTSSLAVVARSRLNRSVKVT
jgi:hypothetical protein